MKQSGTGTHEKQNGFPQYAFFEIDYLKRYNLLPRNQQSSK